MPLWAVYPDYLAGLDQTHSVAVSESPMFRYKLRTLLIVLAVAPALIGLGWWAGAWIREPGNGAVVFSVLRPLVTTAGYAALVLGGVAVVVGAGIGIARLADRR
jgi:hypothetical protein